MANTPTIPENAGYTADSLVQASQNAAGDLSAQSMLVKIFGTIADNPLAALDGSNGGGDILGTIFMYINMGLLTLGAIYLSYKALAAVTQTAHDGNFMGKSFHSVWVPIRITTGIFALIPIAGGWSLLQVAMLWFGIMGAGLGNMAWQGVVGVNFLPTPTMTMTPPKFSSNDPNFVSELFKMHVCVKSHNAQVGESGWGYRFKLGGPGEPRTVDFGSGGGTNKECGSINQGDVYRGLNTGMVTGYDGAWDNTSGSSGLANIGLRMTSQRQAVQAAVDREFQSLNTQIEAMANSFVNGGGGAGGGVSAMINDPDNAGAVPAPNAVALQQISRAYKGNLTTAVAGAMAATSALPEATQQMRQQATLNGFTTAGAWYMTMSQTSYMMNQLTQNISPAIAQSATTPHPDESVWRTAYALIKNGEAATENRTVVSARSSSSDSGAWKALMTFMDGDIGLSFVEAFTSESSGKPILMRTKDIADAGIGIASVVITAGGALMGFYEDSIVGKLASATPVVAAIGGAAKPWVDMIIFVSQLMVGFFLAASLYLPLIPFIIYMGQILNWLITVVEGVAAAPFLGFAHLDTDGEGLGHKTQYGYTFMLSSFMRPVMLVLGFVFACILLEVIGGFVTNIYSWLIRDVQIDSMIGLFSVFGFIAIFLVIIAGLTNSSMTVTYLLPDAIFQFIGAHSSATAQVGRHEDSNLRSGTAGGFGVANQMGQGPGRYAQMLGRQGERGNGGGDPGSVRPSNANF